MSSAIQRIQNNATKILDLCLSFPVGVAAIGRPVQSNSEEALQHQLTQWREHEHWLRKQLAEAKSAALKKVTAKKVD
jgi:hypothetical protein